MSTVLGYTAALLLGSMHALEADHMAAVTAFAVRKPAPLTAAGFGVRWAIGHGGSLLLAGTLLLLVGLAIPEPATYWLDRSVGIVLIALGVWTMYSAAQMHAHIHRHADGHEHLHLHSHAIQHQHDHKHAPTLIGALHGMAGAAPALALLNVAAAGSFMHGIGALVVFAVGTAVGMAAYALLAGWIAGRAAIASERLARGIGRLTGLGTLCIGVYWLFQ